MGDIVYHFLAIFQKLKILWHFKLLVNTGPYGLEISKYYSYSFHLIWELYGDIGYHGEIQAIACFCH